MIIINNTSNSYIRRLLLIITIVLLQLHFTKVEGRIVTINANEPVTNQFQSQNTTYVIKDKLNLHGNEVIVPMHSTLIFDGGQICNGVLWGNSTKIKGTLTSVFSDVQFNGSFITPSLMHNYFGDYKDDTSLLRAMLGLLFSNKGECSLSLEPDRKYDINGPKLNYGHALYEYYDQKKKTIKGNGAIINDLRKRQLVGYKTYDGVLLFSHCKRITISDLNYQNLNEDFNTLYDERGTVKYRSGIENQIGYVGTSFILIQNNCSHFDIQSHIIGARYGIKVGDYSQYWLSGDKGLTNSTIKVVAEKTGYPVAIELGDKLGIIIRSDSHHRAAYLCGLSNSVVSIEAKNLYIAPFHCLLSDTHYSSTKGLSMCYKACRNLDVSVIELGSEVVTNQDAFCVGFQTYNTPPFSTRTKPLLWTNIKVNVVMKKESSNIGLFSFVRGQSKTHTGPLSIPDQFNNISITATSDFHLKQYSARIKVGETAKYKNVVFNINTPYGSVYYDNNNTHEFDMYGSAIEKMYYSGKVRLPKVGRVEAIKSTFID